MGIFFVLIFYCIALTVVATVSAVAFWLGAKLYLRDFPGAKRKPLLLAAGFPFAWVCCLQARGSWRMQS